MFLARFFLTRANSLEHELVPCKVLPFMPSGSRGLREDDEAWAMIPSSTWTVDACRSWIGFHVLDHSGWPLGPVVFLWVRPQTGTVQFLGVPTAWISAQDLLVPVKEVKVDDAQRVLWVPFSWARVYQAPRLPVGAALSPEREQELCLHYHVEAQDGPAVKVSA